MQQNTKSCQIVMDVQEFYRLAEEYINYKLEAEAQRKYIEGFAEWMDRIGKNAQDRYEKKH
jgi:hypothetical protein